MGKLGGMGFTIYVTKFCKNFPSDTCVYPPVSIEG